MTRGNLNEKNDVAHSACCFSPQRSSDRVELCHTSDIMTCNIIATCRTTEVSIYCYSVKFWPQSLYGADKEAVLREKLLDHRDMYYRDGLIFVKKEIQILAFPILLKCSAKKNQLPAIVSFKERTMEDADCTKVLLQLVLIDGMKELGMTVHTEWNRNVLVVVDASRPEVTNANVKRFYVVKLFEQCGKLSLCLDVTDDLTNNPCVVHENVKLHCRPTTSAVMTPHEKLSDIRDLLERMIEKAEFGLLIAKWGFNLFRKLVVTSAKELALPLFDCADRGTTSAKGVWHHLLFNGVRVPAAELDSWICFVNTENRSVATLFISRLIDIGRHFGVRISPPHIEPLGQCLCSQCLAANLWAYLGRKRYRYAVCFADVWNTEMSSTVLRVALKEYGVPCEMVTTATAGRSDRIVFQEVQKILVNMTAKLGGEPWRIRNISDCFTGQVAMIVGLSLGVDHVRKSTITSVAASMNQDATKYFSEVTVHSTAPTAECFPQSFADHLSSALRYFNRENDKLPDVVIVYTENVGQQWQLSEDELSRIMTCFDRASQSEEYSPHFNVTAVDDDCTLKLFRSDTKHGAGNPLCGTLAGDDVFPKDYWLVTEKMNDGIIVTPTRYTVLHPPINEVDREVCAKLTLDLCHLNYDLKSSWRFPAPLAYAKRVVNMQFDLGDPAKDRPIYENMRDLYYFL